MASSRKSPAKKSTSNMSAKKSATRTPPAKKATAKKSAARKAAAEKTPAGKSTTTKNAATAETSTRNKTDPPSSKHRTRGEREGQKQRALQPKQERKREKRQEQRPEEPQEAVQLGQRRYPENPLPEQQLRKPGLESALEPRPMYHAPRYRGSGKLEGKVALITGGDSGIGRAVAVLYAREGADVAIGYLDEHGDAEETRQAVEAEGRRALLIPGDVSEPSYAEHTVAQTVRAFGRLDILVNNAAYQQHQASIEDITDEQLDRTFRTNIYGYFYMARAAVKHLPKGGVIVNSGSVTGEDGSGGLLDYSATKGAIHAFTKSLAQNLLPKGVRVNCVAPGPVWTPLNPADVDAEKVAEFGAKVPMKRPAQPEELAPAYVFLAAPTDSSYITGEVLNVFGGDPS